MNEYRHEAHATFDIQMTPADGLLAGTGRFDFTKTWSGAMAGSGEGVMLSAGDPSSGTAGYVAIERFDGTLDGKYGEFTLQQFGSMAGGSQELRYEIVPGSGIGELHGIRGVVHLSVNDGVHEVQLRYSLP